MRLVLVRKSLIYNNDKLFHKLHCHVIYSNKTTAGYGTLLTSGNAVVNLKQFRFSGHLETMMMSKGIFAEFSLDMDESYGLRVQAAQNGRVNATITGNSFFGVRHGLETLSQLIIYDDIRDHALVSFIC